MISSFLTSKSDQSARRIVDMYSYMVMADMEQSFIEEGVKINNPDQLTSAYFMTKLEGALANQKSLVTGIFSEELKRNILSFEVAIFGVFYKFFVNKSKKLLMGY